MRGAAVWTLAVATGLFVRLAGAPTPPQTATQTQTPTPIPTPTPTPVRSDAAISGTVIDGVTRQPIADVIVQLGWPKQTEYPDFVFRQFTDAKGRFVFSDLPPGPAYVVSASRPGYFSNAFGASGRDSPLGPFIALTEGQWFSTANITLWPPSSISGQVTDEAGEAVVGVFVRLLARVRVGAIEHWASGAAVLTDDRGIYRIGDLQPGRYVVMVPSVQASVPASAGIGALSGLTAQSSVNGTVDPIVDVDSNTRLMVNGYPVPPPPVDGRVFAYPMTFAGNRSVEQATTIVIGNGENRTDINVRLEPAPATRVSGVIDGPPEARANLFVRLLVRGLDELGWGGEAATAITETDGSFTFAAIPAGEYVIDVPTAMNEFTVGPMSMFYAPQLPRPPGIRSISRIGGSVDASGSGFTQMTLPGLTMWARTPVSVGARDTSGIVVHLQPTLSISGRFVTDQAATSPAPSNAPRFMSVQSASGSVWQGSRSSTSLNVPTGEFRIEGLVPGEYLFDGSSNGGWIVKSVTAAGRDHTYTPIDLASSLSDVVVTFTNAIPQLSGAVTTEAGGPAANVIVLAYPVESAQWTNVGRTPPRIRSTQSSTAGSFRFRNLPAGSYHVVAIPSSQSGAWYESGFFQRAVPQSTNVTIDWGENRSITVRLADVR